MSVTLLSLLTDKVITITSNRNAVKAFQNEVQFRNLIQQLLQSAHTILTSEI